LDHRLVARVLLSLLCGAQGLGTIAVDVNRTHATNPAWVGHARFHVVWQTLTMVLLAIVEIGLIWGEVVGEGHGFYVAVVLAALGPVAFLLTWAGRKSFGGELSDPNGIPPVRVVLFGGVRLVDMNVVAVVGALAALGGIVAVYRN
jgi:hypothetical protein